MNLSRRVSYLSLTTLVFWNFILRYPLINGSHHNDGFVIMTYAIDIIFHGNIHLILHPLSYVGAYPFSEPFGVPVLAASSVLVIGTSMEDFALIYGYYISIMGVLSIYLLSNRIHPSYSMALLVGLAYSSSQYFVDGTYWNMSNRSMMFGLIPLSFLYLLSFFQRERNLKSTIIFILLIFCVYTSHRISVYYLFTAFILFVFIFISEKYRIRKQHLYLGFFTSLTIMLYFLYNTGPDPLVPVLHIREKFSVPYIAPILNLIYSYATKSPLSIFSFFGLLFILRSNLIAFKIRIMIGFICLPLPFVVDYEYYFPVLLTPLSIISGYGIYKLSRITYSHNKKYAAFFILFIILYSSTTTYYLKELNTNIKGTNKNVPGVEGFGLSGESRGASKWFRDYIGDELIVDNTARTTYFSHETNVNTIFDRDLISANDLVRASLNIEPYSLHLSLLHLKPDVKGAYQHGGLVDDWSHIRETPIVQEYHFRVIMRTDQDGFLISQYQPKYAVDFLRDHRPGLYEDGHYTDITYYHVLYNEIFDNDYRIYANEQWEFYFLKTDYN